MTSDALFPPIERLVPHAPPMRLVDELVAFDGSGATCVATLRDGHPFVDESGRVLALVGVELLAQTAAVLMGYRGFLSGGDVVPGMLVGVPKFTTHVAHFVLGDVLMCSVREGFTMGRATSLSGSITRAGETVCEGTLQVVTVGGAEPEGEADA